MSLFGRRGTWAGAMGLAVALFAAAPAQAQTSPLPEPGTFDVTPFLGLGFGFGDDSDDGDDLFGNSLVLGAAVAYNLTTAIAVEGELGIMPDIVGDSDDADVSVTTFSANGVYHFDIGRTLVPYATLGLGFGRTSYDIVGVEDDSSTEFAVNLGGGVKAAINDMLAVRGDLRYFNVNDTNPDFWRLYGGVVIRFGR